MGFIKDLFNKITKDEDLERLRDEILSAHEEYKKEAEEINREAQKPLKGYNHYIGVIDSEKFRLRDEIYVLYAFLSKFNDMGKKITPFDFEVESQLSSDINAFVGEPTMDGKSKAKDFAVVGCAAAAAGAAGAGVGALGAAAGGAAAFAVVPAALPLLPLLPALAPVAMMLGPLNILFQRRRNKKAIEELTVELEKQQLNLEKDIMDRMEILEFYKTAEKFAKMYCGCIATVKDSIKKQILPELKAVYCFLFADAIKEFIKDNEDITEVKPNPITYYKDPSSRYHRHYLFVQNAFDYYQIICAFFTRAYLTELIDDKACAEDAVTAFEREKDNVSSRLKEAEKNIVYTEINGND